MTNERLQYLLQLQYTDKESVEEITELNDWYKQQDNLKDITDCLSKKAVEGVEVLLWSGINERIDRFDEGEKPEKRTLWFPYFYKVAAVFLGLLIVGLGLYKIYPAKQLVKVVTIFGEIKTVVLPDGSEVTLNGNSVLTYDENWGKASDREVDLNGEAFFKVVHTADNRKFKVRTTDDFSVDVLGTQFSISNRQMATRVVLNEGKVQCNIGEKQDKVLVLKPGNLIDFRHAQSSYTLKNVEANQYSSWKDRKLILKNTTIQEIGTMLAETYGIELEVEDPQLLLREVSGSVPMDNIETLLDGLAGACQLYVRKEGRKVILSNLKP